MGSIGQSALTPLPILKLQEQSSSNLIENCGAISVPSPLNQHSLRECAGRQSDRETHGAAGRKRSRDEAETNSFDIDLVNGTVGTSFGLVNGSGDVERMVPNESNGFKFDDNKEKRPVADGAGALLHPIAPPPMTDMPVLRSHKSQRLDLGVTSSRSEDANGWNGHSASSSPTRQSPINQGPTIDDFTMHLGVGWSRISSDEDMQAAARGWAKYIENHFQISKPRILLQSKGLSSYLIEASEGWFLFAEDLSEGKLVATSLDRTFENLRTSPPIFDGGQLLVASADPAKSSMSTSHEDMMDMPHIYVGSMNRRKEYLTNSEMGIDRAEFQTINRQDPEDKMDMS